MKKDRNPEPTEPCESCKKLTDMIFRVRGTDYPHIFCPRCYLDIWPAKSIKRRFAFQAINIVRCGEIGAEARHYLGRFFYEGPGLVVSQLDLGDVTARLKRCKIPYQLDNMGLDYIIYAK